MRKKNIENFLKKAKLKHGNKFKYLDFFNKKKNGKTSGMVKVKCPIHNIVYEQYIANHLKGSGCPECGKEKSVSSKSIPNNDFIVKLKTIYGDTLDYSNVLYINNITPVKLKCLKHDIIFEKDPNALLKGFTGCKECLKNNRSKLRRLTNDDYISKAKEIHGGLYSYKKTNYINNATNVIITCSKHGDWEANPANHIAKDKKSGCPKCAAEKSSKINTKDNDHFLKLSKKVHGDTYDYSNVKYVSNDTPVNIICKKHGVFKQPPYVHYRGHGCPVCSESKGERKVRLFLKNNHIEYKREYKLDGHKYCYDFYLPKLNILIEYHGLQHYKPVKFFGGEKTFKENIARDQHKRELAILHNIPLIEVKYNLSDIEHQILVKLSKIYKYRVNNKFYKNFLELVKGEGLAPTTRPKDVKKYLVYSI